MGSHAVGVDGSTTDPVAVNSALPSRRHTRGERRWQRRVGAHEHSRGAGIVHGGCHKHWRTSRPISTALPRLAVAACLDNQLDPFPCVPITTDVSTHRLFNASRPQPSRCLTTRSSESATEHALPVIDLRFVCVATEDYANPIEPSSWAGQDRTSIVGLTLRAATTRGDAHRDWLMVRTTSAHYHLPTLGRPQESSRFRPGARSGGPNNSSHLNMTPELVYI